MNPESKTIQAESSVFFEKVIDALPTKYKVICMLREVDGMDISEISKCLELTNSNVKARLDLARNMMKDYILKYTNTQNVFRFGNHDCSILVEKVMERISNLDHRG
tara:strand:+ start:167 stop:484 length:318 start_codon:yes stop_codon:yes gene_type:complete